MAKKRIIRFIWIPALIGLIVGGVTAYYLYNKPHRDISAEKPDYYLDAVMFQTEFGTDENAANTKYLDKVVQVTGPVAAVSINPTGSVTISLLDEMTGVTCTIDSTDYVKQKTIIDRILTSQTVTLKGRCDGMLLDVRLSKCTMIE